MIELRRSKDRGHFDHGWLDTYHSFSFGDYRDSNHMGFRSLRVINEDIVAPASGFPMHPHSDMEIITYIIQGELEHKDSLGGNGSIKRGQIQRITAGTGIEHSEFNASKSDAVHLLQIWIRPSERGQDPSYDQQDLPGFETPNQLHLMASPTGEQGSMSIGQDVRLYSCVLETGHHLAHALAEKRHAWVQLVSGSLTINNVTMRAGDGVATSEEAWLKITSLQTAEFLLFDLA